MEETLLLLNIFYMDGGKQSPVGFMVTFWQLYFFSYTYYLRNSLIWIWESLIIGVYEKNGLYKHIYVNAQRVMGFQD